MTAPYLYKGSAHPFYKYGETYTLHIKRTLFGHLRIESRYGYENKVLSGSPTKYRGWEEFNRDWKEVKS
jgi:hypothetical protein